MGGYRVPFRDTLFCFVALLAPVVCWGAEPLLSRPYHTNGQLRFLLNGECKAGYVVLATTNFSDWTPVATNQALTSVRAMNFPTSDNRTFFRVQMLPTSPFSFALAARQQIDLNGNNLVCDSYDNDFGGYGMNILWPSPMGINVHDQGDILAGAVTNSAGDISSAKIAGHVLVGTNGSIRIGPNGSVGDSQWAGAHGIKPGWVQEDTNYSMSDVAQPWTGGALTPGPSGSYQYALSTGSYEIPGNVDLSSKAMFVKGNATLWVRGNVIFDNNSYVKMNGSGYRLKLYCSGNLNLAGIWDKGIDPWDLCIYGLPTCTNVTINTGTKMEAVIYAPQADVKLIGNTDLRGAIVCKSLTLTGNASIHYDESLPRRLFR